MSSWLGEEGGVGVDNDGGDGDCIFILSICWLLFVFSALEGGRGERSGREGVFQ